MLITPSINDNVVIIATSGISQNFFVEFTCAEDREITKNTN
jgi:hypothetical protein